MATAPSGASQQVKITDLPIQTLSQLKKQLEDELSHLTSSFQSLRAAQSKFRECLVSLSNSLSTTANKSILVPLTASLYVPGTLADTDKVLVDVGTGYYVEQTRGKAKVFYEGKVKELETNLVDLDKIVNGKTETLGVVQEVLRQKVVAAQTEGGGAAADQKQ